MADISTQNLDSDQDSPRQARVEILETVQRVNELTRSVQTSDPGVVVVDNNLSVTSDATVGGDLSVAGELKLADSGTSGQVMTSQGPGQPVSWSTIAAGDRYKTSSTSNLIIDGAATKSLVVGTNLAYTDGQGIVVASDQNHYMVGVIQSYNPTTGALTFVNQAQVGAGTFAAWTVNITGTKGDKGDQGLKGDQGDQGLKGDQGNAGVAGSQWFNGNGVPDNNLATAVDKDYYIDKTNGDYYQRQAGVFVKLGNLTGPAGSGGSGGSTMIYGTTNRYQAVTTAGLGVSIVSSSTVKTGVAWTRNGTQLTINDNGHGRSVGERAIVRNVNVTNVDGLITAATANSFTIDTTDTGATSGSAGAYSMGFTFAYNAGAGSITGATISAPANWECVLLAVRIHLASNTRSVQTFNLTVPKGNYSGAGPHLSQDNTSVPNQAVRQDSAGMAAVGATISTNTAVPGDFATYQWAALPVVGTGIVILANF